MDDRLKQRLIGATIIVALIVIFIPMLFEEKVETRHDVVTSNSPPLPKEVEEKEIALPAVPDEEKSDSRESAGSETATYRIIPLTDTPPASEVPNRNADAAQELAEAPAEFGEDEGGEPTEVPTRDSPLARTPRSPSGAPAALVPETRSKAVQPGAAPLPKVEGPAKASVMPTGKAPAEKQPPLSTPARTQAALPAPQPKPPLGASARSVPAEKLSAKQPEGPRPATARAPQTAKSVPQKTAQAEATATASAAAAARKSGGEKTTATTARLARPPETPKPSTAPKAAETPKSSTALKSGGAQADKSEQVAKVSEPARATLASVKPSPESAQGAKSTTPKSSQPSKSSATALAVAKKPEEHTKMAMVPVQPATSGTSSRSAESGPKQPTEAKATEPVSKPKSSPDASVWVIQAGNFTTEANAKALAEKLRKNKFAAFVETIPGQQGATYRVQVGPESEKDRAEQMQKRLESSVGIRGILKARR